MPRDHRKLRAFVEADALAIEVYRVTANFPSVKRYGLQSQLRRAALSSPTNIVEGCGRRSKRDWLRFVEIAYSSAREVEYLLDVSTRLGFLDSVVAAPLIERYSGLQAGLYALGGREAWEAEQPGR